MIMMDVWDIAFLPPGDVVPVIGSSYDKIGRHSMFQFIRLALFAQAAIDRKGFCETMNQKE
jgi:hypothetical protein